MIRFLFILSITLSTCSISAQETVYLEAGEFGRGILKSRSGQCYVISPAHVVGDAIGDIKIVGQQYTQSKGTVLKIYTSNDLAITKITSGEEQNCVSWKTKKNFRTMLSLISEAFLEIPTSIGSRDLMAVNIREYNDGTITIKLKSENDFIQKGMSGSSLFANYEGEKVYLGMLLLVEDNIGYVLQADNINRVVFDFFNVNYSDDSNITTTEDTKLQIVQERNRIQKDIDFLESHFEDLKNNRSSYLIVKYKDFMNAALEHYQSNPNGIGSTEQDKRSYRIKSKEFIDLIKESQNLIKSFPEDWDHEAIPQISMQIIKLTDLKEVFN